MLSKLKALRDGIVTAGDGCHDSMGHSAKFGAYTVFCCTIPVIIHFALVQVRKLHKTGGRAQQLCRGEAMYMYKKNENS